MAFDETGVPVSPVNQNAIPIGTVAEAEKEGLDPAVYATCARPNKAGGIAGCAWYAKCRVSAKGAAGPKNYGIQQFKGKALGGGMVNTVVSCMWLADHVGDIEANGGAVKVVAEEGETFTKVTGIAVNNMTGEPTMNVYDPQTHREERRVEVLVKPWPRPSENAELLHDVLHAEVSQIEKERKSNESLARNLGMSDSIAPLDKREGGKRKG